MNQTTCPLINAKWIGADSCTESPILIRRFQAGDVKKATLYLTGLGYFEAKLNGSNICEDRFIPVVSDYEPRPLEKFSYPLYDTLTHAVYYYEYDVTAFLQKGANELTIQLGNGFYRQFERIAEGPVSFGTTLKAIYTLVLEMTSETITLSSDGSETWKNSEITYSNLYIGEIVDPAACGEEKPVTLLSAPDTTLRSAIGTPDRIIRKITPVQIGTVNGRKIFDAGENVSGIVRIDTKAAKGEKISLHFAEKLYENLELNFDSTGADYVCGSGRKQIMEDVFIADGTARSFEPKFVWHTFRYFDIEGDFEQAEILVIHTDSKVTGAFESPSEGLAFLWDAYVRTQLNNMHGSIPSDCPHRERLGYTGDGQICAPTAMMVLDSKEFYRKWIRDILDCQDIKNGHVQHTAPLMGGGGGPGGWGCAIIMVPYAFYKQFGETEMLQTCYEPMQRWIGYLQAHCENGLVTKEEEKGWCLGDWLTLETIALPEPYVNTCYFVKSLRLLSEMALVLNKKEDADTYSAIAEEITLAIRDAYRNDTTGHYCDGIQGADAYAVWAGLVKPEELPTHMTALAETYDKMGHFDTGFLCTDILAEVLIDYGYADVLLKLFESTDAGSFLYMKQHGATTIWEDWKGTQSWCHPMFGGSVRQLFTGFLGIRQTKESAGYEKVEIAPRIPNNLSFANGSILTPKGKLSVSWKKTAHDISFEIVIPEHMEAAFRYKNTKQQLHSGLNLIDVSL